MNNIRIGLFHVEKERMSVNSHINIQLHTHTYKAQRRAPNSPRPIICSTSVIGKSTYRFVLPSKYSVPFQTQESGSERETEQTKEVKEETEEMERSMRELFREKQSVKHSCSIHVSESPPLNECSSHTLMITKCAGRFTPQAKVEVETNTCMGAYHECIDERGTYTYITTRKRQVNRWYIRLALIRTLGSIRHTQT